MRMSGSVCVWDSQRRPLLPTSAAYARTLVQQNKAVLLPHPAVSILQLSHAVSEPVLRPVLLGIALHSTTATVLIFTEALGTTPLLSLTLDLHGITGAAPQAVALTMLARTLSTLLPISQGALVSRSTVTDDPAHAAAIHTTMNTLEACLPYSVPLLSHRTPRIAHDPLLHAFQQQMDDGHDDTTHLAAVYLPRYQPEQHISAEVSRAVRLGSNDHTGLRPGMIVQIRQQQRTRTGLVQTVEPDNVVQVRVPTMATMAGVVWTDIRVSPPLRGWRWEPHPVALLPVAHHPRDKEV
jgi:hypothetical protein